MTTSSAASAWSAAPSESGTFSIFDALLEQVVGVALLRLARVDLVADAVEAGAQERRDRQVRVAGGVDAAVLEAAAGGDAHRRGAVLPAPVLVDRGPEAGVPHAAVGVDRRVAHAHQRVEVLQQAAEEVARRLGELRGAFRVVEDVLALVVDEREVVVVPVRAHARERLRHEGRQEPVLAADRRADLAVGRDVVRGADRAVEAEVELELAGRVLVVAVAHVEAQRLPVLDHVHEHRTELLELVDVVAVRLRDALGRLAGLRLLEPHHLGLDADQELQPELLLEVVRDPLEVLARVGVEQLAGLRVVAVAVHARDARIPGQHLERVEVGHGGQLGLLRAEPDVVAVAVGEEVRGRAVDELVALLRDLREEGRDDALAHHAAGDRYLLEEDVLDPFGLDPLGDLVDLLLAPWLVARLLQGGGRRRDPAALQHGVDRAAEGVPGGAAGGHAPVALHDAHLPGRSSDRGKSAASLAAVDQFV